MLSSSLRRNAGNCALQDLKKRLLDTLTGYISCDGRILRLSCYLVDLINVDNAVLRTVNIIISCLNDLQQNILHILAYISGLREGCGVCNGKRYIQKSGKCLCQQCLTGTGGSQHKDITLLKFNVGIFSRHNALIVIVNGYRQHLFRLILPDHIIIQKCLDLLWFQQIDLPAAIFRVPCTVLIYDLRTDFHAFITDISSAGSCNQFPYLFFCLSAERAADFWLVSFYRHSSIPFLISVLMPKDPRS